MRRRATQKDLERCKEEIYCLYITENQTLAQVKDGIESRHGFHATPNQYQRCFKEWKFRKNLSAAEWKEIDAEIEKRTLEGKESEVLFQETPLPRPRVKRNRTRYKSATLRVEMRRMPERTIVRTPPLLHATALTLAETPRNLNATLISLETNTILASVQDHHLYSELFDLEAYAKNVRPRLPWSMWSISFDARVRENLQFKEYLNSPNLSTELPVPAFDYSVLLKHVCEGFHASSGDFFERQSPASGLLVTSNEPDDTPRFIAFLKHAVYLVSNGLLDEWIPPKLFDLLVLPETLSLYEQALSLGGPTSRAFAEKMLFQGILKNNFQVTNTMLRAGIRVRATHLKQAAMNGNIEITAMLLSAEPKVDPNRRAGHPHGMTALELAVDTGNPEIVKLLLASNATPNAPLLKGQDLPPPPGTALERASWYGNTEIMNVLLHHRALPLPDSLATRPLENFISAVVNEDIATLKTYLRAGVPVNCYSPHHWLAGPALLKTPVTPLAAAAWADKAETVQFLLHQGARVEGDAMGLGDHFTPLQASVMSRKRLVRATVLGTNIDETPNKFDVIRTLFEYGANVNPPTPDAIPHSPLQMAVENADKALVELLLKKGAKADLALNGHCMSAFEMAFRSTNKKLWETFRDHLGSFTPNLVRHRSVSALIAAIRARNSEAVSYLLDGDADINFTGPKTQAGPALSEAILIGDEEMVKFLINRGANINNPLALQYGCTALQAAAFLGKVNLAEYIPDGELNLQDISMALFLAVEYEHWISAEELVSAVERGMGSEYEWGDFGRTALLAAVRHRNIPFVQRLVNLKVSLEAEGWDLRPALREECNTCRETWKKENLLNISGLCSLMPGTARFMDFTETDTSKCALQIARETGDQDIFEFLRDSGAKASFHQENGQSKPRKNGIPAMMPESAKRSRREEDFQEEETGSAHFVKIAFSENISMIQSLLDAGHDINDPVSSGKYNALQVAAFKGTLGFAHHLISERGANVNAAPTRVHGRTALEAAAELGHLDMIQLLLDEGANLARPGTKMSRRLLGFATKNGHDEVLSLLKAWQTVQHGVKAVEEAAEGLDDGGYETES